MSDSNWTGGVFGHGGNFYRLEQPDNRLIVYTRKGAKPVIVQPNLFHRILRVIGLGTWAKKSYIEWVGGEYVRAPEMDLTLRGEDDAKAKVV